MSVRYGCMKPVGLTDPRTGKRPYAAVQLRKENRDGTMYNLVGFQTNLKFGERRAAVHAVLQRYLRYLPGAFPVGHRGTRQPGFHAV